MRRSVLASLALVMLLVSLLATPAAAQEATPEAGGVPEGVSVEVFAQALVEQLPPAPADVALVRASFAPGAGFPLDPGDPSLALVYVESGALAFTALTELQVTRVAVAGTPVAVEVAAAGVETVLGPGDSALFPPFIAGEIRNVAAEPAVVLALIVEPTEAAATPVAATPVATPMPGATPVAEEMIEGIGFQPLAFGHAEALPTGPVVLVIGRFAAEAGAVVPPHSHEGVELGVVETGSVALRTVEGPPIEVIRGLATMTMATPGAEPTVETGGEVTVGPGDAIFIPSGNVSDTRTVGDETAVALLGAIEPVGS